MLFRKRSKPENERSDLELIRQFKLEDDKGAMAMLFNRYSHLVYGVCLKYLHDRDDSKDAVMQIFENLHHVLHQHEIQNFKSWLYTYTKNYCLMEIRKQKPVIKLSEYESHGNEIMENDDSLHLNEKERELLLLENAMRNLNEAQKLCVELFYLQGKSYAEIEHATGFSYKEVKSHLQNAKRNLKNDLISGNEDI